MTHNTHVTFSLNALFLFMIIVVDFMGIFFKYHMFAPVLVGVILGSLLPDIDEPESYIGKRLLPFASIIKMIFGHRGASHYLIVPIMIFCTALFLEGTTSLFLVGLSFGYLLHLVGDMMTLGGIRGFLYPFGSKTTVYAVLPKKIRFRTNSLAEKFLSGFLGLVFFYQIYLIYALGVIR